MWADVGDGFIREVREGIYEYHIKASGRVIYLEDERVIKTLLNLEDGQDLAEYLAHAMRGALEIQEDAPLVRSELRLYFKPWKKEDRDASLARWESKLPIREIGDYGDPPDVPRVEHGAHERIVKRRGFRYTN